MALAGVLHDDTSLDQFRMVATHSRRVFHSGTDGGSKGSRNPPSAPWR